MADNKETIGKELRGTFGKVNAPASKEAIKQPVMSFSQENVYIGLKIVAKFNEKTGAYDEPKPAITATFNGDFVQMPMNGRWWKAYADFVAKMAEAMEGVDIVVANIKDDVDSAKELMSKYKTVKV